MEHTKVLEHRKVLEHTKVLEHPRSVVPHEFIQQKHTDTDTHRHTHARARERTEVIISEVMTEKHQPLKRHCALSPAEVSCEYVELRQAHKHALEATPLQYLGEGRRGRRDRKRKNKTPVVAPMVVVVAES